MQEAPTYAVYATRRDSETRKPVLKNIVKIFDDKEKAKAYAVRKRKERDAEQRRFGDNFTVKKLSAEDAIDQKQKEKKATLTQAILDGAKNTSPEVYALTKALLRENDLTYDQLWHLDTDKWDYETKASEYISTYTHTSTWSFLVSGTIEINGEVFEIKNEPFQASETRRV